MLKSIIGDNQVSMENHGRQISFNRILWATSKFRYKFFDDKQTFRCLIQRNVQKIDHEIRKINNFK